MQVRTEVMDTPRIPWRLRFWPVRKTFLNGVLGERTVSRGRVKSFRMPKADPPGVPVKRW
jgi:hypothetical protein